jgi:capsular exopolysaccharide synthesis family protein
MELRHYLSILWKWAWLLIWAPALAAIVSYSVSRQIQPVYRASATLLVSQAGGSSSLDYSSLLTSERVAKTYAELLTKRPLLEKVIGDLQLDLTPYQLNGKINVVQPHDTQLLELQVEDSTPQLAIAIANSLAASFLEQNSQRRNSSLSSYEQTLAQQIAEVEGEVRELETQINDQSQSDISEVSTLKASLREARLTYATLLDSYLQIRSAGGRSIYVEIVEPAAMPARKIQPRIVFNSVIAAFAAFILSLGFAFLLDYLGDSLIRPTNAEQALHIPVLAEIPSASMRAVKNHGPLAALRPMSAFAEAHRALRTNVQFSSVDKAAKTLLITSALNKEGKTTTIANLGVVMAQTRLKVLLVDADLRRGSLHGAFGLPNQQGLTDLLLADAMPDESFFLETAVPNLYLLPTGTLPPTPSELLSSERMTKLVTHLSSLADVVLFDSPPVLAVTDAAVLATLVDGTLLVLENSRTPKEEAHKALTSLQGIGARVLGAVLVRCQVEASGYYSHHSEIGYSAIPSSAATTLATRLRHVLPSNFLTRRALLRPSMPDQNEENV